jgi:hypothetical protein
MVRALNSNSKAAYEKFLFAAVGENGKGERLSVLSALARADLDPWSEAASLAFLPRGMAAQRLLQIIRRLPDIPPDQSTLENAHRLAALLPTSGVHPELTAVAFASEKNIRFLAWASTFLVAIIIGLVLQRVHGQQIAADHSAASRIPHLISPPIQPTKGERLLGGPKSKRSAV